MQKRVVRIGSQNKTGGVCVCVCGGGGGGGGGGVHKGHKKIGGCDHF